MKVVWGEKMFLKKEGGEKGLLGWFCSCRQTGKMVFLRHWVWDEMAFILVKLEKVQDPGAGHFGGRSILTMGFEPVIVAERPTGPPG